MTAYAVIAIAVLCAGGALAQPGKPEAEAAALAQRTLASSLSVAVDQITIARVLPAEWRDSSLGCPEPGMMYTQVLTRGFDVKLRHAEREHTVHVAGGRAVVCSSLPDAKLSPAPVVAASLKAGDAVRAALAARLGLEPSRVRIVSARIARSDSRPCAAAPDKATGAAFVVEARVESQTFRYYSDDAVTVSCDSSTPKPGRG